MESNIVSSPAKAGDQVTPVNAAEYCWVDGPPTASLSQNDRPG
jgi:hypothetical protein